MLHFFRRHQKLFFLFTTIIVVLSFVFFGTYQAIAPGFNAKNNQEEESYTTQMSRFLNTEQWMISRKLFGCNFLNDDVISKEFLETGMADILVATYPDRFQQDFNNRFDHEKQYRPYEHPHISSLSATSLWSIFAPELPLKLKAHQGGNGSFKERNALFLAQKNFPPAFLSQIIRYQEKNSPHIPPDPRLAREDSALFGYYDLMDWYGENLITAISEIIINLADLARKQGYRVSKNEVLAELIARSQTVYQALKQKMQLPVQDGYGFLRFYLAQIGMKEETALKIWEDVTLFRRLMHTIGNGGGLADTLALDSFYAYAYENALIELIQMPTDLQPTSMEDLKKLEIYLAAVGEKRVSPLDMPLNYAPLETVQSQAPELVGKRFELSYVEVSKKSLQSQVGIKEIWDWECHPENWQKLQKHFPELNQKNGTPFEILDGLEARTKKLVDVFACKQIVDAHPEWVKETLLQSDLKEKELFLSTKSEKPFPGITNSSDFLAALDAQDELMEYTQDGIHFYRVLVKKRAPEREILSYQEALKANLLDKLSLPVPGDSLLQGVVEATPIQYKDEAFAYRFAKFLDQYKVDFPQGDLIQQFRFEKKQKTITRAEPFLISLDEISRQDSRDFSKTHISKSEGAYVYRFIEKKVDHSVPLDKLTKMQAMLSIEARCRYFENLLNKI